MCMTTSASGLKDEDFGIVSVILISILQGKGVGLHSDQRWSTVLRVLASAQISSLWAHKAVVQELCRGSNWTHGLGPQAPEDNLNEHSPEGSQYKRTLKWSL